MFSWTAMIIMGCAMGFGGLGLGWLLTAIERNDGIVCPHCVGNSPTGPFAFKWVGVVNDETHPKVLCTRCRRTFDLVGTKR
jgi:hypothetical protein